MRPSRNGREAVLLAANYDADVGYAWNNIYRLFNVLGRSFHEAGLKVCVSFRHAPKGNTLFDPDLPIECLELDPRQPFTRDLRRIRHLFSSRNIRHIYFTDQRYWRIDYPLLRFFGVNHIVVHNRISVPDPMPAVPSRGAYRLARVILNSFPWMTADYVYAVSDFVAYRLTEFNRFPHKRVRKILNGIDLDRWHCPPPTTHKLAPTFFVAGRATRYKGVLSLIRAAALLRDQHGIRGFSIRFAGDGPDLELLKSEVERLRLSDNFIFLGRLHDTRSEVCGADIVVVPSQYGDACPSTVSEALASGRALIATLAGGIPELVGCPENAMLVPPADVEALAAAMAKLAKDPEARFTIGRPRFGACSACAERTALSRTGCVGALCRLWAIPGKCNQTVTPMALQSSCPPAMLKRRWRTASRQSLSSPRDAHLRSLW